MKKVCQRNSNDDVYDGGGGSSRDISIALFIVNWVYLQ